MTLETGLVEGLLLAKCPHSQSLEGVAGLVASYTLAKVRHPSSSFLLAGVPNFALDFAPICFQRKASNLLGAFA